jgi:outer membrane protein assembly factor BamB
MSDPHSNWDHYSASAALDGAFLSVAARDGCVYALNARSGAQRWRACVERDILTGTPALSRDAVYVGGFDGGAYAFSRADGALLWRRDLGAPVPRDAVIADGAVLFGSRSYDLAALDVRSGEPTWTRYFWFSWIDSPPALAGGALYVGSSDGLVVQALDARTGRRIWAAPVPGWSWARPAVTRASVYASVAGGAYLAPRAGGFAAIDRGTGALRWLFASERPADRAETFGFAAAPAVGDDLVFAADLNGTVYAFRD